MFIHEYKNKVTLLDSTLQDFLNRLSLLFFLSYDYESFPRVVDDPKSVYIAIKDQKNFDEKKNFIKISDSNLTFSQIFQEFSYYGDSFHVLTLIEIHF